MRKKIKNAHCYQSPIQTVALMIGSKSHFLAIMDLSGLSETRAKKVLEAGLIYPERFIVMYDSLVILEQSESYFRMSYGQVIPKFAYLLFCTVRVGLKIYLEHMGRLNGFFCSFVYRPLDIAVFSSMDRPAEFESVPLLLFLSN